MELLLAALALAVVFRVAFAQLFSPDSSLATQQDNTYQLVPIFSFLSQAFVAGEYPYWMNTVLSGMSVFNDPDFSPAYPFYFLRFDVFGSPLAAMSAVHWITVLHLFVLYFNSYVMLRCMRARPLGAFLGASLFALSQNSISYAGWVNIIASYSWLPLVVGAVVLILEGRYERRPVLVGGIALALLTLASPSQPLIHAIFIGVVLFLGRAVSWIAARDGRAMRRALRDILAMGALALLLSAPSIIPAFLNLDDMIRFLGDFPPITNNVRMPYEATLVGQMSPGQLASVLLPLQVPLIVGSWFIGLGGVLFALAGLVEVRRRWLVAPLVVLAAYALLSAMGSHTGFAQLNYHVPFLNMVREPPRHMVVFMLGASALAAFGFDALTSAIARVGGGRSLRVFALPAAVFAVLAVWATRSPLAYAGTAPMWVVVGAFVAGVVLLVAAVRLSGMARTMAFGGAALLVIAANLAHPHANLLLRVNDYFRQANLASHRVLAELSRVPDAQRYRTAFEGDELPAVFWAMNGSYYGLRAFQAFKNPVTNARQFTEVAQAQGIRHYYALLGGKYYVCKSCAHVDKITYRPVRDVEGHRVYQADSALPLYFAVGRVAALFDTPNEFIDRVEAGFESGREVLIDRSVHVPRLDLLLNTPKDALHAVIKEEHRTLNVVELSVGTNRPAIVVLNEYFTDAWIASVNGRPAPTVRINLNQVGVVVESGASLVRFEYRPSLFVWLLRLQAVVAGILVVWGVGRLWGRYRAAMAVTSHASSRSS